jgi:cytochrome c5
MRGGGRVVAVGLLAAVVGCSRALPDAESPGAQLYAARCGTCHALHEPRSLTAAMWDVQVERMRETMRRRGARPLTADEEAVLLGYLHAHATDAGGSR